MSNNLIKNEDEITLVDLLSTLWRYKKFIICITMVAAILTGVISVFFITPAYNSKFNIVINMPDALVTKYGDYTLPITTNQQYIDLLKNNRVILEKTLEDMGEDITDSAIETLSKSISVGVTSANSSDNRNNSYDITVSMDDPKKAKELAENLYNNYKEYIYVFTADNMVNYFTDRYQISNETLNSKISSNKNLLEKNRDILSETDKFINQEEALNKIDNKSLNFVLVEDLVNPNYIDLENDIINIKQTIISDQNIIEDNKNALEELNSYKTAIEQYNNGVVDNININDLIGIEAYITLTSAPSIPTHKSSPSNSRNVIFGTILGAVASGLIVCFKEYIIMNEPNENRINRGRMSSSLKGNQKNSVLNESSIR